MAIYADTSRPTFIDPSRLYSLRGFIAASGISHTRLCEAAREDIKITLVEIGRRKFVRGSDGIAFIERLAAEHIERAEKRAESLTL